MDEYKGMMAGQSVMTEGESGMVGEKSGVIDGKSGTTSDQSALIERKSGRASREIASIEEQSGITGEQSASVAAQSDTAGDQSAAIKDQSGEAVDQNAVIEGKSGTLGEHSTSIECESGTPSDYSASIENPSGTTIEQSASIEGPSGMPSEHNGSAEGQSSTAGRQSPSVEGQSTMTGEKPAMVKPAEVRAAVSEIQEPWENEGVKAIGNEFSFYGMISLIYGIFYSICLYKNPSGILVPVFTVLSYVLALGILKRLNRKVKKTSFYLIGISILISISSCRTGSMFLLFFNKQAVLLLWWVFWLHQFYEDRLWNIGKYFCSVFLLWVHSIGMIGCFFQHLNRHLKAIKNGKKKSLTYILFGLLAAIPIVSVLAALLSAADIVFQEILTSFMTAFLSPWTVFSMVCKMLFGLAALYCLICASNGHKIKEKVEDQRQQEPLLAITVMGIVGLLYVIFCIIQIVYLFMGRGTLPEWVTYSEYAREGFFQLLFVVVINLVLVLLCLKYFKKSSWLNGILVIITLCTYVMTASAGYRMIMYVREYHLTLLRVLVLWFLGVLSILMIGVPALIYKNNFPLFRFGIVVLSVGYLGLAWMRPDTLIARYNISHEEEIDINYLTRLSVDAAPEILEGVPRLVDRYTRDKIKTYMYRVDRDMSWRTFNFSYSKAKKSILTRLTQ